MASENKARALRISYVFQHAKETMIHSLSRYDHFWVHFVQLNFKNAGKCESYVVKLRSHEADGEPKNDVSCGVQQAFFFCQYSMYFRKQSQARKRLDDSNSFCCHWHHGAKIIRIHFSAIYTYLDQIDITFSDQLLHI